MSDIILQDIDLGPLLKAVETFKKYSHNDLSDEQYRAGAIQSFEYCYELSWKYMKKVLAKHAISIASSRDAFRQSGQINLIEDPEQWFEFLKLRNLTVHTYQEEYAEKVVEVFPEFEKALDELVVNLKKQK